MQRSENFDMHMLKKLLLAPRTCEQTRTDMHMQKDDTTNSSMHLQKRILPEEHVLCKKADSDMHMHNKAAPRGAGVGNKATHTTLRLRGVVCARPPVRAEPPLLLEPRCCRYTHAHDYEFKHALAKNRILREKHAPCRKSANSDMHMHKKGCSSRRARVACLLGTRRGRPSHAMPGKASTRAARKGAAAPPTPAVSQREGDQGTLEAAASSPGRARVAASRGRRRTSAHRAPLSGRTPAHSSESPPGSNTFWSGNRTHKRPKAKPPTSSPQGAQVAARQKAPARTHASREVPVHEGHPTREVAAAPSTPARGSRGGDAERPRNQAACLEPEKGSSGSSARAPPRPHNTAAAAPRAPPPPRSFVSIRSLATS